MQQRHPTRCLFYPTMGLALHIAIALWVLEAMWWGPEGAPWGLLAPTLIICILSAVLLFRFAQSLFRRTSTKWWCLLWTIAIGTGPVSGGFVWAGQNSDAESLCRIVTLQIEEYELRENTTIRSLSELDVPLSSLRFWANVFESRPLRLMPQDRRERGLGPLWFFGGSCYRPGADP